MGILSNEIMRQNVGVLRASASKASIQGVLLAFATILLATLAVTFMSERSITLDGLVKAQSENLALWILDFIPFVFAYWGHYSSSVIAYKASALLMDQTEELRSRASRLERQASYAATHDPVTDLPNRALFYDRLERTMTATNAEQGRLAVLLLQVENHKEIRDTLGLNSADAILKQVATRLESVIRTQDSAARLDGPTFAVLLSNSADLNDPELLARRLQRAMEPPFMVDRLKLSAHTSVGVVLFPDHGDDADTLVQRAGVAVYVAAKAHNGYALYSPSLDEHSPRRLALMGELRQALERDQLELHYQPKVDVASGRVIGAEALVRWRHPRHGFLQPDEFIGLAERTRMIKPLTLWVMKRAFEDCVRWRREGLALKISVNLSAQDLHDPELPDLIAGVVAAKGIQPEWVIFEITESGIMQDPDRVMNVAERVHGLGFTLSIDDFGTGYSSLAYLKKLPVSEIKIDKSFVVDMLGSENDAVIVRATGDLAHNLGLKVTAEGVENAQILDVLRGMGYDIAQGYYISRPLPAQAFSDWLQTSKWPPCQAEAAEVSEAEEGSSA
jgi:diguanylate cyclase (GGDEF)-like protein